VLNRFDARRAERRAAERLRRESLPLLRGYAGDRLHVGSGANVLDGWLNTDLYDASPSAGVAVLDITEPLPFDDERFRFVFSEHLIEHVTYPEGLGFLRECRRVLQPGGVLRIATPNLQRIVGLTDDHWYVADSAARHPNVAGPLAGFVINNFMHDWGHQFVYDPQTLAHALTQAGFLDVAERPVGESPHAELADLERHWQVIGREANGFETFVMEATKR
jgi:predicted SAM-dependent methyltransferase